MSRFNSPYPGYDVLAKWDSPSWNEQTRRVIADRLTRVPERRFFSEPEWRCLAALCERVLPQPDRDEPIPIAPWIDEALYRNHGRGTRYAALPPHRDAWRHGLTAIDAEARHRYDCDFATMDEQRQDQLLQALDENRVFSTAWKGLPPQQFFRHIVLDEVAGIYYSHPAAWSEIGFGGPASPRGYVRLDPNRRDPWEAVEEVS